MRKYLGRNYCSGKKDKLGKLGCAALQIAARDSSSIFRPQKAAVELKQTRFTNYVTKASSLNVTYRTGVLSIEKKNRIKNGGMHCKSNFMLNIFLR